MRRNRRNLLVLVIVVLLVVVSGLVIAKEPTRLGLDLKGGVELVYQATPTGQSEAVSGGDIDTSIEIIRERIDELGVAEPEVSQLGEDGISVSLPDVSNAQRAIDRVGTTAQLFFYDWEPNLIAREKAIGGQPGRQPPPGPLKAAEKEWKDAGRPPKKPTNQRLIFSGAYPTAYGAVQLAAEQEPKPDCTTCSTTKPRYYLFAKNESHDLIAGPENAVEDLYIDITGRKRAKKGEVVKVPVGTTVVRELPQNSEGEPLDDAEPGWYALSDEPALSGTEITDPKQESSEFGQPTVNFNFTDEGREAFHDVTREIAQRGQEQALGLPGTEEAEALSGHF